MEVRRMRLEDLGAARALLGESGYEQHADAFRAAFVEAAARPDHALLVAAVEGRVVGWLHVFATRLLHDRTFAEIGMLVVEEGSRRQRAGTSLMRAAEDWARATGCALVRVRSRLSREGTHRFYVRIGYAKEKTQYTFARPV